MNVHPFAPSGNIYVSDPENGFFIFSFSGQPTTVNSNQTQLPDQFVLFDNYSNPFNPETTIFYQLPRNIYVELLIYHIGAGHLDFGKFSPKCRKILSRGMDGMNYIKIQYRRSC